MTQDVGGQRQWMERDLYGYGPDRPDPKWPKGANVCVNFVLNFEEGGERSVEDGDAHAETVLNEFGHLLEAIPGERDHATESQSDYGSRVGIWRIMKLFKKHGIPITFHAVGRALERNPAVARYAEENGHEIASHAYKWLPYTSVSAEDEENYIRKAVEVFKNTSPSGRVPVGWFYGRPSARSAALVAKVYKELGLELLWWGDTYADDLPYYSPRPGADASEQMVMMPYSIDTNDYKFWSGEYGSDEAFVQRAINGFETIREEGLEGKSAYITVALHTRWIGRPGRFPALKRIVEHFIGYEDVWFATKEQIARHWLQTHPYVVEG